MPATDQMAIPNSILQSTSQPHTKTLDLLTTIPTTMTTLQMVHKGHAKFCT